MNEQYPEQVLELTDVLKKVYYQKSPLGLDTFLQGEMKVLTFIYYDSKTDVLPGEIASQLDMTGGRVAGILRSLEKKGYIVRRTDEADRRRVLVNITENGSGYVRRGTDELMGKLSELTVIMGGERTKALIASLNDFICAADAMQNGKSIERT